MARRKVCEFNDEVFCTKQELQGRVQGILGNARPEEYLSGRDAALMVALLDYHPRAIEKIGGGVSGVLVRSNPSFGQREFWVRRIDGSIEQFSYKKCLAQPAPLTVLMNACRHAVSVDIRSFKERRFREGSVSCPYTGLPLTLETCEVDHIPPRTFKAIVTGWCIEDGIDPEQVEFQPIDQHGTGKRMVAAQERLFGLYHDRNAQLRIVSPLANRSHVKQEMRRSRLEGVVG